MTHLGLTRGTVELYPHEKEWDKTARKTIALFKSIFGDDAVDIQHIGSSSIPNIPSKPIIDIAIAVKRFEDAYPHLMALESHGFIRCNYDNLGEIFLSKSGDLPNTRTHHIHTVLHNSRQWNDYIFFRDYLTVHPDKAYAYGELKQRLKAAYPYDRTKYTEGKAEFIEKILNLRSGRNNDKACEIIPGV